MPRAIHPLNNEGQCIMLVLAALYELKSIQTKKQTIAYIETHKWFNFQPSDLEPYPSHRHKDDEPRWHTLIAFGRQRAIERDLLLHFETSDQWKISPKGIERFERVRDKLRSNEYNVRDGYLWSPVFKNWLCPNYEPSAIDAARTSGIEDLI